MMIPPKRPVIAHEPFLIQILGFDKRLGYFQFSEIRTPAIKYPPGKVLLKSEIFVDTAAQGKPHRLNRTYSLIGMKT